LLYCNTHAAFAFGKEIASLFHIDQIEGKQMLESNRVNG